MDYKVISLSELFDVFNTDELTSLLQTFKGITLEPPAPHDVEIFLHHKAIDFEKSGISSTYLVFDNATQEIAGFFSLANRPLIFDKENYQALSNNQRKKISRSGRSLADSGGFIVNSYLIGQLGKNYQATNPISGTELLTLACQKIQAAAKIINTKYIWLECDNNPKLIHFYRSFEFSLVENFQSGTGLKVMIIKIQKSSLRTLFNFQCAIGKPAKLCYTRYTKRLF